MRNIARAFMFVLVLIVLVTGLAAVAEEPAAEDPASPARIREAMMDYFKSRLRADLGLTDAQVAEVGPRIERLERSKAETRRVRMETIRRLRRAVERGAPDADLNRLLRRLDDTEWNQRLLEREVLAEIDEQLTARQRVKLRFFMPRFRRELTERIRQLRGDRGGADERRFPRGLRAPGGQP